MAVGWKLVKKRPVEYSSENPPTVSLCLRLSTHPVQRRGYTAALLGAASPHSHLGFLLVAIDQAKLSVPDEYKDISAKPYAIIEFDKSQAYVDACSGTIENPRWKGFPHRLTKFLVSRAATLTIHIYLPTANDNQDIALGTATLQPDFQTQNTERQFGFRSLDLHTGGSIRMGAEHYLSEEQHVFITQAKSRWESFHAAVPTLQERETQRVYAVREVSMSSARDPVSYSHVSRMIDHTAIAPLLLCLDTEEQIYFLSPLVCGGHLFYFLQMERTFGLERSTLYAAEILSALEFLHSLDTCRHYYGCLQPSAIRLDAIGHIVLCDFGLHIEQQELGRNQEIIEDSWCPAPEVLLGWKRTKATDWWILGSVLYEMLLGIPPFIAEDRQGVHKRILANESLQFPEPEMLSTDTVDILRGLLCQAEQRLGANGALMIKEHPFFHGLDWNRLSRRGYTPVFKPGSRGPTIRFSKQKSIDLMRSQFQGWGLGEDTPRIEPRQHSATWSYKDTKDPVERTQILGIAVDRQDVVKVQDLLAENTQPDFPDYIHPTAHHPRPSDRSQDLISDQERDKFLPPLVRAVGLRDMQLARMLLSAGANANVGFHYYYGPLPFSYTFDGDMFDESCGRVVQLAMRLKHEEMVDLLCDFGADVDLAQPVLRDHQCEAFERSRWVQMLAGLMKRRRRAIC